MLSPDLIALARPDVRWREATSARMNSPLEWQTCLFSRSESSSSLFEDAMVRKHLVQIESIEESRFHLRVNEII